MKNFKKFLEEITIKGNPGIPGEGHKDDSDKPYLSDIELRAKQRLELGRNETPHRYIPRLMQLIEQSQRYLEGKKEKLEELATKIILENYGEILEGVELDIKFATSGRQISNFMKEDEEDEDDMPKFREIKDEELIRKIHKAKIANNIIQGEAKNTKHILHTDAVKDGLRKIYGNDYLTIFNIWDEITKIADKLDWIIPIEAKASMLEQQPEGMAGAVKLKWKKNEEDEEDEDEEDEDIGKKVLSDLEKGEDEDEEEYTESHTPVIMARGIDFPMLLHEAVKGIYELIASISIPAEGSSPKEIEDAKTVKLNVSSFEDEAEDFRTGPEIAADFRDFINKNPKAEYSQNMRAFIFGKMMDESYMSSHEFLKLFRGILNQTPEARRKIDSMISEIIEELKKFDLGEVLGHESEEDTYSEEPSDKYTSYTEDDIDDVELDYDDLMLNKPGEKEEEKEEENYSKLSQKELQSLIDNALDAGDYEKVHKISQYLKEGREIYLNELNKTRKSKNIKKIQS